MYSYLIPAQYTIKVINNLDPSGKTTILLTQLDFFSIKCYGIYMKDFKKFGDSRGGGRPSFGGKPSFNKFGGDRGDRPAMMHKATCAECSKICEVPFRPNGEKPVFCNDCFSAKRGGEMSQFDRPQKRDFESSSRPGGFSKPERRFDEPRAEQRPDRRIDDLKQQVESLNAKMDSLIAMMSTKTPAAKVSTEAPAKAEPMKKAAKPTAKKVAVKTAVKKVVAKKKK
ncbi:MAG: hypothetical protein JWL92_386 [Candidatus Nomurabacteria bacterium]|nr:hypothetical protein [Candidatus Nomurabacteria bacterium]